MVPPLPNLHAIGYAFRNPCLLEQALTHKSYINEVRGKGAQDNERLEFLGDSVLALIISEHLAVAFPEMSEGELSRRRARLVSEPILARVGRQLGLGPLLRVGRGEELTQGRDKPSLLADALEALIAAVYLDGGLEAARAFTLRAFTVELQAGLDQVGSVMDQDYKTRLQEWCQRQFEVLPQYKLVGQSGPDHQKVFEVQLSVRGEVVGTGVGRTKKEAEQQAARRACEHLFTKD